MYASCDVNPVSAYLIPSQGRPFLDSNVVNSPKCQIGLRDSQSSRAEIAINGLSMPAQFAVKSV